MIVKYSFKFGSVFDLAIDRQIHVIHLGGDRAFEFTGERAHHVHIIFISLSIRYVPFGHHERPILVPIFLDVLHNLSNKISIVRRNKRREDHAMKRLNSSLKSNEKFFYLIAIFLLR